MRTITSICIVLFMAAASFATGLPPLSPTLDFTYTTTPTYTGYNPGGAAVSIYLPNVPVILYGTPSGGGSASKIEITNESSADWCYGATCPSTTSNYPQPNYVFPVGNLDFAPTSIVAGTGINTLSVSFGLTGDMEPLAGPPPFYSISATDLPIIHTGLDSGGTTSYIYFVNPDGSVTNVLHVPISGESEAGLEGVLLDPPGSLTFDILGFTSPTGGGFLTPAPTPEPGGAALIFAGIAMLGVGMVRKRRPVRVPISEQISRR